MPSRTPRGDTTYSCTPHEHARHAASGMKASDLGNKKTGRSSTLSAGPKIHKTLLLLLSVGFGYNQTITNSVTSLPGIQGRWVGPTRSGAACRVTIMMARTGSGPRGHRNTVSTRFKSRRPGDVPYTRWQLRVVGLGRRDGPLGTATLYNLRTITQWVLKSSNGRKAQCACARS